MHQVHTLNPSCAPTAPRPRAWLRVVARAGLYRGAHETVSWPPPGHVAGVPCRVAARHIAGSSAVSQHSPGRVVALYRDTPSSQAFLLSRYKRLYCDTPASQIARLSRYKDCIVTQPPSGQPLAFVTIQNGVSRHNPPVRPCVRALLAVSWPPLAMSWSVSWPSRPYRGRPYTPLVLPCCAPKLVSQALPVKPCVIIQFAVL